jgi:glycosyltransferase involved in cell wall biosynthesis
MPDLDAAELPRRVLFLNWRDTEHPEGGGSEIYVEQVAAWLADRGVEVTLFCARPPGLGARERRQGFEVIRRGGRFSVYLWAALLYLTGRFGPRPDVVVEVHNGVPFLARLYARRPVVVLVHHVHREQWRVALRRPLADVGWWLESRVAPRVNRAAPYVTVSEHSRCDLASLGIDPEHVTVVHNGRTHQGLVAEVGRATSPTIAVVGRLVPHKRVELALDAADRLRQEIPNLRLVVVGHGWWRAHLDRHVERLGLQPVVEFLGHVDDATKHAVMRQAWLLAVPSLKEGWGLVVIEAGEQGTPAVGFTSAGGVAESIVDGQTGLLAPDADEFTGALRMMLTDVELRDRLGAAARLHAAGYSWAQTGARFAQVLARECGGTHRPVINLSAANAPQDQLDP